MNSARLEEAGLVVSALQQMVKRKLTVYKHARVELARVPGAEKLRVRVTKDDGDAGDDDLANPDADDTADEKAGANE